MQNNNEKLATFSGIIAKLTGGSAWVIEANLAAMDALAAEAAAKAEAAEVAAARAACGTECNLANLEQVMAYVFGDGAEWGEASPTAQPATQSKPATPVAEGVWLSLTHPLVPAAGLVSEGGCSVSLVSGTIRMTFSDGSALVLAADNIRPVRWHEAEGVQFADEVAA
jgi:hypothetical protein